MYKEIDDNELIWMVKEDSEYCEVLMEKYKFLIIGTCRKYFFRLKKCGYEFKDLIQIANITLIRTLDFFKEDDKTLYYTYLKDSLENSFKSLIRQEGFNKRKSLNDYVSYDELLPNSNYSLLEVLNNPNALNPYDEVLLNNREIEYRSFLNSLPIEVAVSLELKSDGLSIQQISSFLKLDNKTISRFLYQARKKFKNQFV